MARPNTKISGFYRYSIPNGIKNSETAVRFRFKKTTFLTYAKQN